MATKPLLGGTTYNQAMTELRNAAEGMRVTLEKTMTPNVGPNLMITYLFKISWFLSTIFAAIATLEKIGQAQKDARSTE